MISSLRELSKFVTGSAGRARRAVDADSRRKISRGQDPNGKPWQPTKAGERPLKNAGAALSVKLVGKRIVWTLKGIEARHHLGAVKGKVKRQIIPIEDIPSSVAKAITQTYNSEFARITGSK